MVVLEFCKKCGSRMLSTEEGLECRKCGTLDRTRIRTVSKVNKKEEQQECVYVLDEQKESYTKISKKCPKCGATEVLHGFYEISGEHAGVKQERTVEYLRCIKCSHDWIESY